MYYNTLDIENYLKNLFWPSLTNAILVKKRKRREAYLRHVLQFQVSPNTLWLRLEENSPTSISDI